MPKSWMERLDVEQVVGFKCEECGEVCQEPLDVPLYECGNCGLTFNRDNSLTGAGTTCPSCNKFSKKVSNTSCPECEEGPLEEVVAWKCGGDGNMFEDEGDLEDHLVEEHGMDILNALKEAAP